MSNALTCPNCAGEIPSQNINIDRMVAVCPTCDTIFQFDRSGKDVTSKAKNTAPTTDATTYTGEDYKTKIKNKPRNITPSRALRTFDNTETGGIEIQKRDRNTNSGGMIFMIIFTLAWDSFMLVWFGIAIRQGEWGMAAFGTIHGAVGVGLTYWILSHYLNMTRIRINPDEISITTAPVYIHAPRRFRTEFIDQVYVKQTSYETNGQHHYDVMLDMLDKGTQKVVGGFVNYTDAAYVEREIERFLGIEDQPVPGEANPRSVSY